MMGQAEDVALVAKHYKRGRDLKVGDNVRGLVVIMGPTPAADGWVRTTCRAAGGKLVYMTWSATEWIPLGEHLPPRGAHEALLRVHRAEAVRRAP